MPDTIVNGNSQNMATAKHVNTHSKFDMSYHSFDTFRFGELHPHFVMECVPKDKINLRCEHNLRSYSLKAPLMQKIQLKKDYFAVPMEAILPFNWDKIYTNPVIGDDVPSDAGTYVEDFSTLVDTFMKSLAPKVADYTDITDMKEVYTKLFNWILTCELFASNGNLMSSLGIHLGDFWRFGVDRPYNGSLASGTCDECVDALCFDFLSWVGSAGHFKLYIGSSLTSPVYNGDAISMREALELMRDNLGNFTLDPYDTPTGTANYDCSVSSSVEFYNFGLDIKRLWAYQIVCAHYYSNDHVDYIYSADLFRQYINNLIHSGDNFDPEANFSYNGISTRFDYLSAYHFSYNLNNADLNNTIDVIALLAYLQAIFGYKHSLRYVDYFVGARTRPLAVGDVNVDVQSGTPNYVSIIDVTQRTQMQKYLNAINRSGRKFSNYIKELFGENIAPDYHNPFYLGHTADDIYGQEIENTNVVDQESNRVGLSVVSNLRSNASRFEFSFDADRPCIVIGVSYFDVPRSYWRSIERQNFHKDRFDMFNPYMQFIGDQQIYGREFCVPCNYQTAFGYTNRYQEYHQRYNQAQGGFIDYLPGYCFLNDKDSRDSFEDKIKSPFNSSNLSKSKRIFLYSFCKFRISI